MNQVIASRTKRRTRHVSRPDFSLAMTLEAAWGWFWDWT
jgi:hypothetical protein